MSAPVNVARTREEQRAYQEWAKSQRRPPGERAGTHFPLSPKYAVYVPTHSGRLAVGGFYVPPPTALFQGGGPLQSIANFYRKPPCMSLYLDTFDALLREGCMRWEMIDTPANEVWVISTADAVSHGYYYRAKTGDTTRRRWGVPLHCWQRYDAQWQPLDPNSFDALPTPTEEEMAGQRAFEF